MDFAQGHCHSGDVRSLSAIHVNHIPDSLQATNTFTFENRSFKHYVFIMLLVAIPVLIIYAVFLLFRTPLKRKWLWLPFILVEFVQFTLNWTTSAIEFKPFSFILLGVGMVTSSPYAPWMITVSFPLEPFFCL